VKVSIVIPVFNQLVFTRECLSYIRKNSEDIDYQVIVIDNGSTDGTGDYLLSLLREWSGLIIQFNKENLRAIKAWNQGLEIGREHNTDIFAFLNNDIVVPKNWLRNVVDCFEKFPDIACISPLNETNQLRSDFCERSEEISKREPSPISGDPSGVLPAGLGCALTGFCFFVRRTTFDELGKFDERLDGIWYEDSDWLKRLNQAKKRVVQIQNVLIHHYECKTLFTIPDWKNLAASNEKKFKEKWGE